MKHAAPRRRAGGRRRAATAAPVSRHRGGRRRAATRRPPYARLGVAGAALTVGALAFAGWDLWPGDLRGADPAASVRAVDPAASAAPVDSAVADGSAAPAEGGTGAVEAAVPETARSAEVSRSKEQATAADFGDTVRPRAAETGSTVLPADSGRGRRVVFSEGRQRVWLVGSDGDVERTYLASGSIYDNLDPGTFEVFSRSESAIGIDDSGTMEYFVRFTHGTQGAAIGFHTIPVADGEPVQTLDQLGTPLSHGCIRQARADALALWDFAPIGTTVVVTP